MGREAVRVAEERVVLDGAGLRELRERLARTRLSAFGDDGWVRCPTVPGQVSRPTVPGQAIYG